MSLLHPYESRYHDLLPGRRALQEVIDEFSGGYLLKDRRRMSPAVPQGVKPAVPQGVKRNILLSSINEELVYGGEEISEEQVHWKEMLESAADNIISFLEKL